MTGKRDEPADSGLRLDIKSLIQMKAQHQPGFKSRIERPAAQTADLSAFQLFKANWRYGQGLLLFLDCIQAVKSLLDENCLILASILKVHERQKSLVDTLSRHKDELRSVKAIVEVIEDEDDLQTPYIDTELIRLREILSRLAKLPAPLNPIPEYQSNHSSRRFSIGSSHERLLNSIMAELGQSKTTILKRMSLVLIFGSPTRFSAVRVKSIDKDLRDRVRNFDGLRIAQLIKGRQVAGAWSTTITLRLDTDIVRGWYGTTNSRRFAGSTCRR